MAEKHKVVWSWPMGPQEEEDRDQLRLEGQPVRAYDRPDRPQIGVVLRNWWEGNNLMVEVELDDSLARPSIDLRGVSQQSLRALHRGEWWKPWTN